MMTSKGQNPVRGNLSMKLCYLWLNEVVIFSTEPMAIAVDDSRRVLKCRPHTGHFRTKDMRKVTESVEKFRGPYLMVVRSLLKRPMSSSGCLLVGYV